LLRLGEEVLKMVDDLTRKRSPAELHRLSLEELVDYVVSRFHIPLREQLVWLESDLLVLDDGGAGKRALEWGREVIADTEQHLQKEEQVVFPWLLSPNRATAGQPIRWMEIEHDRSVHVLARLEEALDAMTPTPALLPRWRRVRALTDRIRADLVDHIEIEDRVLFPRALRGLIAAGEAANDPTLGAGPDEG
jgi:regulator of cell morphogenesis and NO signaling